MSGLVTLYLIRQAPCLLIAVAMVLRILSYRGYRKKTTAREQAVSGLAQKENI